VANVLRVTIHPGVGLKRAEAVIKPP
jgi:hypothetical protein